MVVAAVNELAAVEMEGEGSKENDRSDRYYCPFPGCTRSFAELWRLKVHYRAPPDVRGSGKERGHGQGSVGVRQAGGIVLLSLGPDLATHYSLLRSLQWFVFLGRRLLCVSISLTAARHWDSRALQ